MVADFKIIGRATRDTELLELPSGTHKATISLATNDKDTSYYYTLIAFEKTADLVANYVTKGKQVYVQGKIKPRSYEKDGKKFYVTDYIVQHIEFLGSNSITKEENNDEKPF